MGKANGAASLSEAIDKLESATQNKSTEFKSMLENEYQEVRKALDEVKPHLKELKEKIKNEAEHAKHEVEEKVKEHPWYALAIVGLIAFVIGWLFGHGRKD